MKRATLRTLCPWVARASPTTSLFKIQRLRKGKTTSKLPVRMLTTTCDDWLITCSKPFPTPCAAFRTHPRLSSESAHAHL
ncbi:hypothetical protein B0H15DRAFT_871129, partial [Mycena belliarum]